MIINVAMKELKSLFASPMGWIILSLLMFGFGFMYLDGVNKYFEVMSGSVRPAERVGVTIFVGQTVYGIANFLLTSATPLLTMRLISEERKNQKREAKTNQSQSSHPLKNNEKNESIHNYLLQRKQETKTFVTCGSAKVWTVLERHHD